VILDQMYKCLGDRDENSARDMNSYWTQVERWCSEAGASVIVVGHFPKGDQTQRASLDRQSGSNVNSRDPDVVANFDKNDDKSNEVGKDVMLMEFSGMREDLPVESFFMQWAFPVFHRIAGTVAGTAKKGEQYEFNDYISCLAELSPEYAHGVPPGDWLELVNSRLGTKMKASQWSKKRAAMEKGGLIRQNGPNNNSRLCRLSERCYRTSEGNWKLRAAEIVEEESDGAEQGRGNEEQ
jgi:hypothetical protein